MFLSLRAERATYDFIHRFSGQAFNAGMKLGESQWLAHIPVSTSQHRPFRLFLCHTISMA
jgi:hypothetical protein